MNHRCKPGDLAIVIQAQNPGNLGLIVRVLKVQGTAQQPAFAPGEGPIWECECAHPMVWTRQGRRIQARSGPIPDRLLQPIRGSGLRTHGTQAAIRAAQS